MATASSSSSTEVCYTSVVFVFGSSPHRDFWVDAQYSVTSFTEKVCAFYKYRQFLVTPFHSVSQKLFCHYPLDLFKRTQRAFLHFLFHFSFPVFIYKKSYSNKFISVPSGIEQGQSSNHKIGLPDFVRSREDSLISNRELVFQRLLVVRNTYLFIDDPVTSLQQHESCTELDPSAATEEYDEEDLVSTESAFILALSTFDETERREAFVPGPVAVIETASSGYEGGGFLTASGGESLCRESHIQRELGMSNGQSGSTVVAGHKLHLTMAQEDDLIKYTNSGVMYFK